MNILKRRQLEKQNRDKAIRQAAKNIGAVANGLSKPVSKLRQNLEKKQAKKSIPPVSKEADQLDDLSKKLDSKVEDAKDELTADLENQTGELGEELDSLKDDVSHLESRVDENEDDIQSLKSQFEGVESTGNPELETHKAIVEDCLKEMSNLDDIAERLPHKAEACKRLEAFVTGYMQSAAKYPNSVAVWFMIWLFDLGDIAKAVPLALHLSAQKVHKMPTRFKCDIQCFICDKMYDWAKAQLESNKSAGPYLDNVIKALEAEKWELSKIVKGKMYVIRGKHLEANGEDKAALADFEKAMSINGRAGASRKIEKLKAKLGIE